MEKHVGHILMEALAFQKSSGASLQVGNLYGFLPYNRQGKEEISRAF